MAKSAPKSWLAHIKTFMARHMLMHEFCHRCGMRVRHVWWSDDELWSALSDYSILCLDCFDDLALERGMLLRWRPESI